MSNNQPVQSIDQAQRLSHRVPYAASDSTSLFSLRGVEHSFGQVRALRGIDLEIEEGEVLAIMGPSGSGKSTLLHVLAGVISADFGNIEFDNRSLGQLDKAQRASLRLSEFGFVFQFGQLLPDLTAIDNVSLPLLLQGYRRSVALSQAKSWLQRLGLGEHIGHLPSELSGGQAQRVAVARALVTGPRVVFADEPTGSLDSLAAEQVISTLTEVARANRTTVVLVTHDPRTASYADREVIVRDGRIAR